MIKEVAANNDKAIGNLIAEAMQKVRAALPITRGFDAETNEYVDMMQAGIIDPTKVERIALQNAASIASLLLTNRSAHHGHAGSREG